MDDIIATYYLHATKHLEHSQHDDVIPLRSCMIESLSSILGVDVIDSCLSRDS